jgi:lyso-ornithine lipid O-acyltransferase
MRTVVAAGKISAFLLLTALLGPLQILVLLFHKGRYAYTLPYLWHKCVTAVFAIRTHVHGTPHIGPHTLYVANHLSYLDITALGSVVPVSFVAKREVASWPIFGFLARMQQTAFIDRAPKAAAAARDSLAGMLESGKSLILFPEGTSTDGRTVLPFKSSLFALALPGTLQRPVTIQPISINLEYPENRDLYAWYGDMELVPHLWAFAKTRGARVVLHFHAPLKPESLECRKCLAQATNQIISRPLSPPSTPWPHNITSH